MKYMNKVLLIGRLTRDPEIRYSQGEKSTAVARYTLAVDRNYKKDGEQGADFIPCVTFGGVLNLPKSISGREQRSRLRAESRPEAM